MSTKPKRNQKAIRARQFRREIVLPKTTERRLPAPMDLDFTYPWRLIWCAPNGEAKAQEGLESVGCQTFWPALERTTTIGDKTYVRLVGTFSRYLFATGAFLGSGQDEASMRVWRAVRSIQDIDGISNVVGTSSGWLTVPPSAIKAIAAYQNAAEEPEAASPVRAAIGKGEQVMILSGPFMGFMAAMVEAVGMDKARIALEAFGRETLMEIDFDQLIAA